jgi:hypothetical protein
MQCTLNLYLNVLLSNPFPWRPSSTLLLELVAKVAVVLMAKVAVGLMATVAVELMAKVAVELMAKVAVGLMAKVAVGLGARLAAVKVAVEVVANKVDVEPVRLAAELSAKDGIKLLASGVI